MDALSVCGHIDFSWMSDFRVGLVDIFYINPLSMLDQIHFRSDMRIHAEDYMLWLGRLSFHYPGLSQVEVYWHDIILDSGDDSSRL
jgi:hypothetical protein